MSLVYSASIIHQALLEMFYTEQGRRKKKKKTCYHLALEFLLGRDVPFLESPWEKMLPCAKMSEDEAATSE